MTPTELRDWRIKVCTDLANGVQYQIRTSIEEWQNYTASAVAAELFDDTLRYPIRPAPTPRKVWVAWSEKGSFWCATTEAKKREVENDYPNITINWQLVEESLT